MAEQFPLPPSVESLIQQICLHQSQPPLEPPARQELASLGEEASLKLLTDISRTTITRSFDGFVSYLARQYRSPDSPVNYATPPRTAAGIELPAVVEELIGSICRDQSQPPLGVSAKRKLAMLEEEEAIKLLETIRRSKITRSFDGFVMTLLKSPSPSPSPVSPRQESVFSSPSYVPSSSASFYSPCSNFSDLDEIANSVQDRLTLSPVPTAMQLGGQTFSPSMNNIQCNDYEHAPSPATNVGIYNGHSLSPSTSAGTPNGQFMSASNLNEQTILSPYINVGTPNGQFITPPTNIFTPNAQAHVPSINASKPNGQTLFPCSSVVKPNAQACVPSVNAWRPNGQTVFPSTSAGKPNGQPNSQALVPSMNALRPDGQASSPVLQALHQLEYRKAFLILSYIGRNKLDEVTNVDEINSLAGFRSMEEFENRIWHRFGARYCHSKDRVKHADWESGGRYYYHCYVYSDGSYSLKGPYLSKTVTLLHKVLGDENVLIVKFHDLDNSKNILGSTSILYAGIQPVVQEGIFVGLKRFRFFVFKDGGKEEKNKSGSGAVKSYYVNVDSFSQFYQNKASSLDMISMHDRRCIFMHVHTVSSLSAYMARFSLILSKTFTLDVNLDDSDVCVEDIGDISCKDNNGLDQYDMDGKLQIHTDGTGFISEELALRCPRSCYKGSSRNDQFLERYLEIVRHGSASTSQFKPDLLQPPLLIQFRMFYKGRAVKGTVLVNKKLQGKIIQIRPSMIKVDPDPGLSCTPAVNSFEIVTTSKRPGRARLSRSLIGLLHYGGVPRDFFIDILSTELYNNAHNIFTKKSVALRVAVNHREMDDNYTIARMILLGIPLEESYIQWRLPILGREELKSLKEARLPIGDSFFVMGTADPTGSLKSNEVCVIYENGQIEGDVLVYRHPGEHFGDVHILKATRVRGLEDVVGASKYGIFFPTKGPRSLADKMAGGDFDGDMYLVSRHPTLLTFFKQSEPWTPTPMHPQSTKVSRKPSEFTPEELEHELFNLFFNTRFRPSFTVGQAADAWLGHMDKLLSLGDEQMGTKRQMEDRMRRLVDVYYEALDAPKKGKKVEVPRDLIPKGYPHYMGRKDSYHSTSVLGEIYDRVVDALEMENPVVQVRKLPCFDIEVPLRCIISWEDHYTSYRNDMSGALKLDVELKNDAANYVIHKYRQILYGVDEFEKSPRSWEELRFDALAIYHVSYNQAMQQNKANYCGVAWRVAGPALLKIFMEAQDEKPILCLPSVLREIL